jgi:hypothetical protein
MGFPDPEKNTANDIYQREFSDAERQQIKLDLLLLSEKVLVGLHERAKAQRRLSISAIKMYQSDILELSPDEFEALASGVISKEIRGDIEDILYTEGDVLMFRRPNEK